MATIVYFHAHPDDECILTGGSIARASDEGHRVVLVTATNGDHGEVPDDLRAGETLVDRRRSETEHSAAILGISRIVWLGYEDSGMTGWEQNQRVGAFCNASLDEAAHKLAAVLDEEHADFLVTYDWHGGYGHPDHIMVHKVGHRAHELRPNVKLFEATMNRDRMRRLADAARSAGISDEDMSFDPDAPADDGNPMGSLESEINISVDVTPWTARKRQAVACHASQVSTSGFFLSMDEEMFALAFGNECYISPGDTSPMYDGWILA
jgi:LmbE family N-acetylglucosaminyl deacetylase